MSASYHSFLRRIPHSTFDVIMGSGNGLMLSGITLAITEPDLCCHMASIGYNKITLTCYMPGLFWSVMFNCNNLNTCRRPHTPKNRSEHNGTRHTQCVFSLNPTLQFEFAALSRTLDDQYSHRKSIEIQNGKTYWERISWYNAKADVE